MRDQAALWLELYVQSVVVEGRRQGKVPVFGGIRVLRERRKESDTVLTKARTGGYI